MELNPIAAIGNAISGILNGFDKLFTSDEEKVRAETAKIKQEMQPHLEVLKNASSQIEINKIEAKHPSLFVAGARPAILWVFAISLMYQFLLYPLLEWVWMLLQPKEAVAMAIQYCGIDKLTELKNATGGSLVGAKDMCMSIYLKTSMPPRLNMEELWPLVAGMLGLAGWRTIDKANGVARENMNKTQ